MEEFKIVTGSYDYTASRNSDSTWDIKVHRFIDQHKHNLMYSITIEDQHWTALSVFDFIHTFHTARS